MIGALIAGGSSLLGGLSQNKAAKKQAKLQHKYDLAKMAQQYEYDKETEARQQQIIQNTEEGRFKWLVKGAQDAGFNPLTVLGATGGAMGSSPTAAGMQAAARTAPLSNIGNTIAQAGNQFAALMPDPIKQETQRLENQLLTKQIAQIDREALRYGQPRTVQSNSPTKSRTSYPVTTQFGPVAPSDVIDEAQSQRAKEQGSKNTYSQWKFPDWLPTTQTIEDWYGDGAGFLYGSLMAPYSAMYNARERVHPMTKPMGSLKYDGQLRSNPAEVLKRKNAAQGGGIITYPLGGF